jgi:hypothetical protein
MDMTMPGPPLRTPSLDGIAVQFAYFGMSAFFVLSGFVIHYNYIEAFKTLPYAQAARYFFAARFARLYPLYALAIVLNVLYSSSAIFGDRPGAALAYLTMTASWFNLEQLVYPPAWSISTEWYFYFVFALIAPIVWRARVNIFWLLSALLAVPAMLLFIYSHRSALYPVLNALFWHDQSASAAPDYWFWYYAPYVRFGEFLIGMLASSVYLGSRGKFALGRRAIQALELAALGWCLSVIFIGGSYSRAPLGPLSSNFAFAPALVVVVLLSGREHSLLGGLLCSRVLMLAGDISYSVYIFQWWAKITMNGFFVEPESSFYGYYTVVSKIIAIAFVSTLMAYGSYHLFEWPTRRWLRSVLIKPTETIV